MWGSVLGGRMRLCRWETGLPHRPAALPAVGSLVAGLSWGGLHPWAIVLSGGISLCTFGWFYPRPWSVLLPTREVKSIRRSEGKTAQIDLTHIRSGCKHIQSFNV